MAQRTKRKRSRSLWWAFGAAGAFLLAQTKALLALFQVGKAGGAILSMGIAIAFYAWFYQWEFAIGVTVMVLVHELGHVMAAKRKGIPVTAPFFIPFLGALIMLKRNPRDAVTEAYVALGGPLVGSAGALVSFLCGWLTGHPLLYAVAYIGFTLNLINLLPIHPLDGGRIASTITRWLWVAGLVAGIVSAFSLRSVLLFVLSVLFAWDLFYKYAKTRGKTSQFSYWGKIEVPFAEIRDDKWMLEPFREGAPLPYTTYSDMDGTQWVEIEWEQAGVTKRVKMVEQGLIRSVKSVKFERRWQQNPKTVTLRFQIDYEAHDNEQYYEVPSAVRWKFGIAYGALALFLMAMMAVIQGILAPQGGFIHSIKHLNG